MKTIQLKNIELEVFESAFSNFKKFVSSDFEFDYQKQELSTYLDEFNKWHLVTLASFYGGDLFKRTNELEIVDVEQIEFKFKIDYNLPKVEIRSKWGDVIEFNPGHLHSADYFLTDNLNKMLSETAKYILQQNVPGIETIQSVFLSNKKYAYFISKDTLVIILAENNDAVVTKLFKIRWNEI
jgi:hypothetical protein